MGTAECATAVDLENSHMARSKLGNRANEQLTVRFEP